LVVCGVVQLRSGCKVFSELLETKNMIRIAMDRTLPRLLLPSPMTKLATLMMGQARCSWHPLSKEIPPEITSKELSTSVKS
jgi:hypothetical protein